MINRLYLSTTEAWQLYKDNNLIVKVTSHKSLGEMLPQGLKSYAEFSLHVQGYGLAVVVPLKEFDPINVLNRSRMNYLGLVIVSMWFGGFIWGATFWDIVQEANKEYLWMIRLFGAGILFGSAKLIMKYSAVQNELERLLKSLCKKYKAITYYENLK